MFGLPNGIYRWKRRDGRENSETLLSRRKRNSARFRSDPTVYVNEGRTLFAHVKLRLRSVWRDETVYDPFENYLCLGFLRRHNFLRNANHNDKYYRNPTGKTLVERREVIFISFLTTSTHVTECTSMTETEQ